MHKIAVFMMSKKFIPVMLVLMGAGLFVGLKSMGKSENNTEENPKLRDRKSVV